MEQQDNRPTLKCYRVLFGPDDTAFMVWAYSEQEALQKAMVRNNKELDIDFADNPYSEKNYIVDEFAPETNGTGIMTFYDCYAVFERKGVEYDSRIKATEQEGENTQ